jgi:hypothetical protein
MKKLILFSFLLIILVSCGNKITFTKEFSYLPMYSSTMKLASYSPAVSKSNGFSTARYTINNSNNADVLLNYEKILKKNGWSIYDDHKPYSFGAQKGTHQVTLVPQQSGNDVILNVMSK